MMKFVVLVIIINYCACARGKPDETLDEIVDRIFNDDPKNTGTVKLPTQSNNYQGSSGNCKCVPYYLCINGTVSKYGESVIDYRMSNGDHISQPNYEACSNYLEECCTVPEEAKQIDSTPVRSPPKQLPKCGVRNPEGVGFRITSISNESNFGEFPWMLVVLTDSPDGKTQEQYHGGASLIHPQVALTAAHLFINTKNKFKVRAGDWDLLSDSELFPHQDRDVVSTMIHPEFNSKTAFNDFALLFLNASFKITENVDVVCLPTPNTKVEAGTRCFTSGWGKDKFGKNGKYSVIPKKIEVPVLKNEDCQKLLRNSSLGEYFELSNTFMCAGGESNQDTCKGDGGSALVCPVLNHPGIYEQYGIVSWGIGCGEPKLPGVYSAVAKAVDWIEKEMKSRKLDFAYNRS